MRKILVTGANGQLGSSLRKLAAGSADEYIFTDVAELDITDADAVNRMVTELRPDILVNCAAYTNVDAAEDDEATARRLNAAAAGILARAMDAVGGLIIHVSTDYVFGADTVNTPCTEELPAAPLGVYGRTKLEGEKLVRDGNGRHIIIRTAWLYSEYGRNFVRTMLSLTSSRPQVNVVFDQVGSPTYAPDLAAAILTVIDSPVRDESYGTYHFSDEGVCSWYDLATLVARLSGADCRVLPCHSSEFPSKVVRPAYSVLDKTKIKNTFGVEVPYWTDSLQKCLNNLAND